MLFSLQLWAQEEVLLPVPFYVDEVYSGEITLKINGEVLVEPRPLFKRLAPLLDEEKLEQDLHKWRQVEWTPYENLADSLIIAEFDETRLIFLVEIPPGSRKPGFYSLVREEVEAPGNLAEPAVISGVLNMEGWSRVYYDPASVSYEIGPELGVNYSDYVLETKAGIQSEGDLLFLDYARVVKDFIPLTLRAEAGNLSYDANGFSPTDLVGFSVFRKTSLDMNYLTVPELGQTIFFPEPAEVEILVNGKTVRRRRVPAGVWTFRNFPLSQGPNDVEIVWSDSAGQHREFFFQIYDSNLLKDDETDWGASIGTDSWTTFNPAFLGHVNHGFTHVFSAGAGLYYDMLDTGLAMELPLGFATPAGNFQVVPSANMVLDAGYGSGVALNHSFSEGRPGRFHHSFGSSWGFKWSSYAAEMQEYSVRAYYNYSPLKDLALTPSVNWYYEAVEGTQTVDFFLRARKSGSDGSTLSAQIGMTNDEDGWAPKAALTYTISFPDHQQSFYANGDITSEKMTLAWNRYSKIDKQEDYNLSSTAVIPANPDDRLTLSMGGGYIHPLFQASIDQGVNGFMADEHFDFTTTLSAGTALVYADGVWGWSRPVKSEFVIIESEIGPLAVNPTSRGALLEMDGETPGVISSLSPYRYSTLRLVPDQLPIGSDISDYTVSVFPSYRSGTLLRVEEKVYMYVGGILMDENGEPLDLILGEVFPIVDPEDEDSWPREFFTDESGYFECYGLVPGKFRLTQKDSELIYSIEVVANDSGYENLGEVEPDIQN